MNTLFVYNMPGLRASNVDRFNERKWFYEEKKKARSRRYPAEILIEFDFLKRHINFCRSFTARNV